MRVNDFKNEVKITPLLTPITALTATIVINREKQYSTIVINRENSYSTIVINRYIRMDAERFTDIFSRMQTKLRHIALRIVGNEEEASDAVQDAFVSLWRKRNDVADDSNIEGLVTVSVRNRCLDEVRDRSRHRIEQIDEAYAVATSDNVRGDTSENEILSEVEALIQKYLSERDREILILRDKYGWDFEEVAEKFDMTPAAVRMALSRARKAVAMAYRERNGDKA